MKPLWLEGGFLQLSPFFLRNNSCSLLSSTVITFQASCPTSKSKSIAYLLETHSGYKLPLPITPAVSLRP
uniref:Uncharacterized protein n=1 Tax=Arundo donax TaxID=35708 RepID=A0A0A9BED5_ARUDO